MKNLLLIGGAGFLGKNIARALKEQNLTIINNIPIGKDEFDFADVRILSLSNVSGIISVIQEKNIDIVLHLVSSLIPTSTLKDYNFDVKEIYIPTVQLLEYCSKNKIKFAYISSGGAIYGRQNELFNENTLKEPVSYYGLSKLCIEEAIQFFHRLTDLNYLILRPSNPYGYGQNLNGKQGIVAVIMGKILRNEVIEIWGDGSAIKDYIYIDDFVYYVVSLLKLEKSWNQIYNIGTNVGSSVNDVLEAFKDAGAVMPPIKYIEQSKTDVNHMILDCSKIQKIIPHETLSLRQGVKKFYLQMTAQNG